MPQALTQIMLHLTSANLRSRLQRISCHRRPKIKNILLLAVVTASDILAISQGQAALEVAAAGTLLIATFRNCARREAHTMQLEAFLNVPFHTIQLEAFLNAPFQHIHLQANIHGGVCICLFFWPC
jgi:hypothetical protein